MNIKQIKEIFYDQNPDLEISSIISVKGDPVIIFYTKDGIPEDSVDNFMTIKDGQTIGWTPLDDIQAFHRAAKHPIYTNDELKHFGVKGMKWGVIHEDPLLGIFKRGITDAVSNTRNLLNFSSEKIGGLTQQLLSNAKQAIKNNSNVTKIREQISGKIKEAVDPYKDAADYVKNTPEIQNFLKKMKGEKRDPSKDKVLDLNDVVKIGNAEKRSKDYKSGNINRNGYATNCPSCTLVTELKKRGIDCETAPMAAGGKSIPEIFSIYRGEKTYRYDKDNIADVFRENAGKPGSHGAIQGVYENGGGHIFNYTVMKDGSIQFEDAQVGFVYHSVEEMQKNYKFVSGTLIDLTTADIDIDSAYKQGFLGEPKTPISKIKLEDFRKENRTELQTLANLVLKMDPSDKKLNNMREFMENAQLNIDYMTSFVQTAELYSKGSSDESELTKRLYKEQSDKSIKDLAKGVVKEIQNNKVTKQAIDLNNAKRDSISNEKKRQLSALDKQIDTIEKKMKKIEHKYVYRADVLSDENYKELIKKRNSLMKKRENLQLRSSLNSEKLKKDIGYKK